ncbi:MAG TPA: LCCL domain-containing protein [Paracoccaceae bacterium]|nr:LCCL domain-containing protein [Paracoccaceae bacterium]HMO71367.1 LCCL domain-containing protein [Paracoccaceae bacterium]
MKRVSMGFGGVCATGMWLAASGGAAAQGLPECGRYPLAEPTYTCSCPAGPARGSVWGSGPYTADSDICTAARHAGMITDDGGAVMALRLDGLGEYPASERNGVRTSRWGRYDTSIMVAPAMAAAPTAPAVPEGPVACTTLGPDVETRCTCDENGANGAIWGAGPYTSDSDLCTAARHAGAIGLAGGEISVIRAPGLTSYKSTERNGILSMEWGEYGESFFVNANN